MNFDTKTYLPDDYLNALLVGRINIDNHGPSLIFIKNGEVYDITSAVNTCSKLLNKPNIIDFLNSLKLPSKLCDIDKLINMNLNPNPQFKLLAPVDLQSIKACGVTFANSMLERVVEEKCKGDASKADKMREEFENQAGVDISKIKPNSLEAKKLKQALLEQNLWSQYLEVGLGEDAEVFTKSQPMSSLGFGDEIGLHPKSQWNNPEPEVVLAVNNRGVICGASLGNDVNLRDIEGRSALLLGKAKDNNGSCSIGPFIRLCDDKFGIDDIRQAQVSLDIFGEQDNFELKAISDMAQISRDPLDLVEQTINDNHQYPDGLVLFLGTLFAPTKDRGKSGLGFTHKIGDKVSIQSPKLGALVNKVNFSNKIKPWEFGVTDLIDNLKSRDLL